MKTQGQILQELAQESQNSTQKTLEGLGKQFAETGLQELTRSAKEWGTLEGYFRVEGKRYFVHRHAICKDVLKYLPIDIGCQVYATDKPNFSFTLEFSVVEYGSGQGGEVDYDFPKYCYIKHGLISSNVHHLEEIGYDPDVISVLKIFEHSEFLFESEQADYAISKASSFLKVAASYQRPSNMGEQDFRKGRVQHLLDNFFPT